MSSSRTVLTVPERFSGFYLKKRKWPLNGYHKRFFIIENGYLKYGKNEEIRKVHGRMDLGDAMISSHKKGGEIHLGINDNYAANCPVKF